MNKTLTGYPSIDRPQEKYYRSRPTRKIKIDQNIYDLVFCSNKDNIDSVAVSYLGNEFSYRNLKEKVDALAKAFLQSGFTIGDTVLIGLSNTPETKYAALNLNNKLTMEQRRVLERVFDLIMQEYDEKSAEMFVETISRKF